MRFFAIIATLVAFFSFALADSSAWDSSTQSITATVTMTFYRADTTTYITSTKAAPTTMANSTTTAYKSHSSTSLTAATSASATIVEFTGGAAGHELNLGIAALAGAAAWFLGSL